MEFRPVVHKLFYYQNKIRSLLVGMGYSQVQTYSFRAKGEVEIQNPFAKDKPFVRQNITDGLLESLVMNARNVDLLGEDTVKIFEMGSVFTKEREYTVLGLGYVDPKKKKTKAKEKEELENVLAQLSEVLGGKVVGEIIDRAEGGAVVQIDLTALAEVFPQPESFGNVLETNPSGALFKTLSPYPFMVRDVAVFVNNESEKKELEDILRNNAGILLAREPRLFDEFVKKQDDGTAQISYAYKLVFQAYDRTLTDVEVNAVMDGIHAEIGKHAGWEVR
jgi:phenylalanyl-tRNA synthetase beta subunit